jgi:hypothetical protein
LRPNSDDGHLSRPESTPSGEPKVSVLTGAEVSGATPVPRYEQPEALISIIVETVWSWIEGIRMRLRIGRDLGRKATDDDLTSIDTWMKVDEVEQREKPKNPLNPD